MVELWTILRGGWRTRWIHVFFSLLYDWWDWKVIFYSILKFLRWKGWIGLIDKDFLILSMKHISDLKWDFITVILYTSLLERKLSYNCLKNLKEVSNTTKLSKENKEKGGWLCTQKTDHSKVNGESLWFKDSVSSSS